MNSLVYKILGSLSGLILYWSVSPMVYSIRVLVSLAICLVVSVSAASFTVEYLSKFGQFSSPEEALFVAAALNGLFVLPLARFLSAKANRGEIPNPLKDDK